MLASVVLYAFVFGPYLVGAIVLVVSIFWLVREFGIKAPRRRKWVAAHDGHLIGSDEFFAWCRDNDENPCRYL